MERAGLTGAESARLARLARLKRLGGWLSLFGLLATAAAAAGLLAVGLPARALRGADFAALGPEILGLSVVLAIGAVFAVGGLALYVGVPGLDAGLAKRDFDHPLTMAACLAAVFVLGNALPLPFLYLGGAFPALEQSAQRGGGIPALPVPALAAALVGSQAALMIVLIWRIVRPGAITWADMGLTTDDLGRRLAQGAVGGLAIFVVSVGVAAGLANLGLQQTQVRQFTSIAGIPPTQFLGIWLLFVIVAPICEEAFFRGYVFTALRGRYGRIAAYVGSALLFSAIHLNLPALIPILLMATGLAFLYDRSRSIVPGIVAHGLNNSVALTLVYARVVT